MAHGRPGFSRGATPSTRAVALAACVVALGLLAWRGSAVLTRAPASPGPLSQTEASLLSVAEALAGQGHVRVSVTRQSGKAQQVLVLLDENAPVEDAVLSGVVASAAGTGTVDLQRVAFAPGISGAPKPSDWAELSLLALLAGLAGWLGFRAPGAEAQSAPVEVMRETLPVRRMPQADEAPKPAAPARNDEAADLARRDPARAAAVVRGWMGKGDAA